jgi:hypothetical protein
MPRYFPQHTVEWRIEEPPGFRRLTLSLVAMALLAGMLSRLVRWVVMGSSGSGLWFAVGLVVGVFILLGLATAHLGNFPVRHWVWRAPAFGFLAGVAEALTSAGLVALGVERFGTSSARWSDWLGSVGPLILVRLMLVSLFAAVLAAAVQLVRLALLKREHREHTARAIHEEHLREARDR